MARSGTPWKPSPAQAELLNAAGSAGYIRNISSLCDEARVPRRTFYNWLRDDPEFRAAWTKLWEQMVEVHFPGVVAAMVQKAQAGGPGSVGASRLIAEMKGVIKKRVELTGKDGGPVQTVDVARLSMTHLQALVSLHPELAAKLGMQPAQAALAAAIETTATPVEPEPAAPATDEPDDEDDAH